jgi:hypothetical protein
MQHHSVTEPGLCLPDGRWWSGPASHPKTPAPYGSPNNARVASHAYNYSDYSLNFAARMDYLVQRDDFMQVVGNNDYGAMGDEFNAIVVVSTDGAIQKTDAINDTSGGVTIYKAGRVSPTVTGPYSGSPSDAIGQVAGIVGLLVSRGKTTTSNATYTTATTTAVTAPYAGDAHADSHAIATGKNRNLGIYHCRIETHHG